jgi:hypothetical protein
MKIRLMLLLVGAFLLLTGVGSAHASAIVIFNDGAIDVHDNAAFITGSKYGNFENISNGFTAAASATPTTLTFGLWIDTGIAPAAVSYEIGTSAFATDLGSGMVTLNGSNRTFLFHNIAGDVYFVTIPVTSLKMIAGDTYWLSLSNANDGGIRVRKHGTSRMVGEAVRRSATSGLVA